LPLGNGTITPAEPDAENEPGKRGGRHYDQMAFSQSWPYPAKKIESNYCEMQQSQQYVGKFQH
jgi:hypothetical protein